MIGRKEVIQAWLGPVEKRSKARRVAKWKEMEDPLSAQETVVWSGGEKEEGAGG